MPQFTEFYCQAGGSNTNAGSTTNNTAAYASTNGNWNGTTSVFTPTDGSTPASTVNVGDFASLYPDGAAVSTIVGRITAVAAGVNGGITISSSVRAGATLSTSATGRSIKVGGAWLGPQGSVNPALQAGFPLTLNFSGRNMQNLSGYMGRLNMKNDQVYTMTTTAITSNMSDMLIQGYTATPGDGGFATITTGASSINILVAESGSSVYENLIFDGGNQSVGGADLAVHNTTNGGGFCRCVAKNGMGCGFRSGGLPPAIAFFVECEAYNNNRANLTNNAGFKGSVTGITYIRCISHHNAGSNTPGWYIAGATQYYFLCCIADSNGQHGFQVGQRQTIGILQNCDAYNNVGDGINIVVGGGIGGINTNILIHSCNLIKNGGWGINSPEQRIPAEIFNCGFGSGTQANASGTHNNTGGFDFDNVTYAPNVTPYNAPTTGDFSIVALANGLGRGFFLQTQLGYSGTLGFPDIGAAQSNSLGGLTSAEVSAGYA